MYTRILIVVLSTLFGYSAYGQGSPKELVDQHCPGNKQFLGPAMIMGKITDADSNGAIVPGASVTLTWQEIKADSIRGILTEPRIRKTVSNPDGTYYLCGLSPKLEATLAAQRGGQSSTEIPLKFDGALVIAHDIEISKSNILSSKLKTLQLPTVTVKEKFTKGLIKVGFARREREGQGKFITRKEIDKRSPIRFTEIFTIAHGLRAVQAPNGYNLVSRRTYNGRGCVNYYVDGVKQLRVEPGDIDTMLKPDNVAGIEVYHPPNIPQEFQSVGRDACSTIVVWTAFKVGNE